MTEIRTQLAQLETQILTGKQAVAKRNDILTAMHTHGATYADLYRLLNEVRRDVGAPTVTRDAINKAIGRHKTRMPQ
jgi:hypothetical protein